MELFYKHNKTHDLALDYIYQICLAFNIELAQLFEIKYL